VFALPLDPPLKGLGKTCDYTVWKWLVVDCTLFDHTSVCTRSS